MKEFKSILALIFMLSLLFSGKESKSQCSVKIFSGVQVAKTSISLFGGGERVWACEGVSVTDNGGADTVFLEKNCTIVSNGGDAVIYAKEGCTINLNGGGEKVIYQTGTIVYDIAGDGDKINCSTVTFDYSNAPSNGCSGGAGVEEEIRAKEIRIYPNPFSVYAIVDMRNHADLKGIFELYDYTGKACRIFEVSPDKEIRIERGVLSPGMYFFRTTDKKGFTYTGKLILQ